MNEPTSLIHNIRLTEKASLLGEKHNQYVFRVDPRANKLQIKQAIQEKGDEVWRVLEGTKKEFGTFETLMTKMESQVGTVQNTIQKLGIRTRAINRTLREVGETDKVLPTSELIDFDRASGITTFLATSGEDD